MNERREQTLTTADVASATERPTQEQRPARTEQRNQPQAPAGRLWTASTWCLTRRGRPGSWR